MSNRRPETSMSEYLTNSEYLSSKGVDTDNYLEREAELDSLANADNINSSLSDIDIELQSEAVDQDGVIDLFKLIKAL
ncbi:hypothetical protein [Vibrio atypicus]|uniref:hypothetical protein n=1 Tax=Vibrio atypicus TaxID=558271 RepID=UPI00135AB613|nr:hypothetical protein [Vibrio atypicus]